MRTTSGKAEAKSRRRRSDEVVSAFFEWQKLHRERLLAHPAVQRNPRLFSLGYILSEMFDWETYECDPGREYLAARLGVVVRSISPLTHELQEIGFLRIKRRRNRSAIYLGVTPQEGKQTSYPDANQEGKSSRSRKGSKLPIGKGSQLPPNVVGNVVLNEVSGAHHAPSDAIETSSGSNNTETAGDNNYEVAPSAAPGGAPGASSNHDEGSYWPSEFVLFQTFDDPAAFIEEHDPDLLIRAEPEALRKLIKWIGRKYGDDAVKEATERMHARTLTIAIIRSFRRRAADVA